MNSPTQGTVQSGPYSGSGFTWYVVNWDTGINGYTVQDFYQLAAASAPTLNSISPNPVTGSSSAQTFTLSGSNFVSGAKVQVAFASNGYTFTNTSTNASFVSSTQLTVPITTSTTADTWKVRVQNPDSQLSGQINLVVNAPASTPAPTLNSISPNPVTGSSSAQTFTLSGSNFVSGAKVQVAFASNGYTFTNTSTNASFVSSTQLTVPITTSTTADTWKVRVQNPDAQLSGQINLVVNAPASTPAPTLSSISPNPVTGSSSAQTFTLSGSNFVSGAKVQVAFASNGYTFTNTSTNASFVSSTQLTVPITTSTTADTWNVRVQNPDGQLSGQINLVVNAPTSTPAPTLNSISPNPVTGSSSAQTFTLSGSNFASGAKVQVAFASNGYTFTNTSTNASFVSSSQLTVPITTSTTADTWKVRVQNPDGQLSGQINLVVNAPTSTPAPTLNSISPNPVTGSSSAQTFTLSGSNFVSGAIVQVAFASNGYTFINTSNNATFVSSTQLTVPITTSTTADTWKVRVQNPDGQLSAQINLVVNAPASTPTPTPTPGGPVIANVSPNPVTGSLSSQPFTIDGSNFTSASVVNLRNLTTGIAYLNRTITSQTSTRLVINPVFGTEAHSWSVEVVNGSASSGQYPFQVNSPTPALSIVSILPSATQQKDWGQTISYTVTVRNSQSAPAQGVTVTVHDGLRSQLLTLTTNAVGQATYSGTVPNGISGLYQVSFQASATGYAASANVSRAVQVTHVTQAPTVTITSPHVGDSWQIGTSQIILASISGNVSIVHFEYSLDGGSTWAPITTNAVPSGAIEAHSYWPITGPAGINYKIKASVDWSGGSVSALSGTFNVINPSVSVCSSRSVPTDFQTCYDMWRLAVKHAPLMQRPDPCPGCIFGSTYKGYNTGGESIADSGCLLVSLSMLLRSYGANIDPPDLNDVFVDAGAFMKDGSHQIASMKTGIASATSVFAFSDDACPYFADGAQAFNNFLEQLVCNRSPAIVQLAGSSSHYVVVTAKDDVGFVINDPGRCPATVAGKTLHLGADTATPYRVRGYLVPVSGRMAAAATSGTPDAIHVSVNAVATLMVTDPAGSRTGMDLANNLELNEIPHSGYFVDAGGNDFVKDLASSVASVDLNALQAGTYRIDVVGKDNGRYTVELRQFDQDGTVIKESYIVGTAQPGSTDTYYIVIGGAANLSIASSASNSSAHVGDNITYTFTVKNVGSTDASAVTVADKLPAGASLVAVDGAQYVYDTATGTVAIAFNTLEAGASATVTITVRPGVAGVLTNKATVSSVETDTDATDNTTTDPITISPSVTLGNISTRLNVATGDNALIGGFIITGTLPKKVIVRGIGPSLVGFGLSGVLPDPMLELHDSSQVIGTNDDWQTNANKQEIIDRNVAPNDPKEAAILTTLNPGTYTAILRGANNGTGIGTVEVYDLDQTVDSKLANISTRGFVDTGDNVMIGGTIITGTAPANVLIRAIGPSLTNFGVPNALQDPTLELHNAQGGTIVSNDNWVDSPDAAAISATKLQPTDNRESAILANLQPGQYTAIVRGSGNSTGVALVEAYQLQ